ncbi:MAG: acetoacetate decarboxylase family protein [Lachnospiraceae bacterium]|nr:acetoacetate decarboxylase family protein [Lachnospiraceae bacterium]
MYEKLFEKGKIGNVELKNRLVMTPMGTNLAELDGTVGPAMLAYFEARAKGGCGLIMPEICKVNEKTGVGMFRQIAATSDKHIPSLAKLASTVHKYGSKIFIQLHHPGREGMSSLIGGQPCVSASDRMCKVSMQETRPMTLEEIHELIDQFGDAALRCKKAGIDGVELHCAHGYLLQQFLSPYTNKRTDEYGGSFENRMRIVLEIIEDIRNKCGKDYVLGCRVSVDEFLNTVGVTEDYIHIEDGIRIVKTMEAAGIDFVDVSCALYETGLMAVEPISFPQGWRKQFVKAVRDNVSIPVIAVSSIREPAVAEAFLEEGVVDFVGMGRTWLADPEWGRKVQEGRESELKKCINCLRCFETLMGLNAQGLPFECAVNPLTCNEYRYGDLVPDTDGHKVVVVGGGPGGMTAAETLAKRGVKVTLIDRQETLGGTVNLAKLPPLKERMEWIADYYRDSFAKLGVEVQLGKEATAEEIAAMKPDAVVLATGSRSIVPKSIPGIDGDNVCLIEEVLTGKKDVAGKSVAMIGAGLTGLETGEFLGAKGCRVTFVDMLKAAGTNAYKNNVLDIMTRLNKMDIAWALGHALKEITPDGVIVENVDTKEEKKIEADAVVLSLGYKPDQSLKAALEEKGIPVKLVGSAIRDGVIAPATRTGYEVGASLFKKAAPSFVISKDEAANFAKISAMDKQEGIYLAYLTDPAAIRAILPKPLEPFSVPVVTLSVCHIKEPSFADNYYETILGVYCTYKGQLGMYPISLLLGGDGAEMATQLGRDNSAIPKKLGAEFVIRKNGTKVNVGVVRRGAQIINVEMELGAYNHPLTHMLYQAPAAGKETAGSGYYFHFDRLPDEEGKWRFTNTALIRNVVKYKYDSWIPGTVTKLELNSSLDDPWGCLPINTICGGAYAENNLLITNLQYLEAVDAEELMPMILPAWYDRTTFMEGGRK